MQITLQVRPEDKNAAMDVYYAIGDNLEKHGLTFEVDKYGDEDCGWEITLKCHDEPWQHLELD